MFYLCLSEAVNMRVDDEYGGELNSKLTAGAQRTQINVTHWQVDSARAPIT